VNKSKTDEALERSGEPSRLPSRRSPQVSDPPVLRAAGWVSLALGIAHLAVLDDDCAGVVGAYYFHPHLDVVLLSELREQRH